MPKDARKKEEWEELKNINGKMQKLEEYVNLWRSEREMIGNMMTALKEENDRLGEENRESREEREKLKEELGNMITKVKEMEVATEAQGKRLRIMEKEELNRGQGLRKEDFSEEDLKRIVILKDTGTEMSWEKWLKKMIGEDWEHRLWKVKGNDKARWLELEEASVKDWLWKRYIKTGDRNYKIDEPLSEQEALDREKKMGRTAFKMRGWREPYIRRGYDIIAIDRRWKWHEETKSYREEENAEKELIEEMEKRLEVVGRREREKARGFAK